MPAYEEIAEAINSLNMIAFTYEGKRRICEPHVLGATNGKNQVLTWQESGASQRGGLPEWRRFDLDGISKLQVLGRKFGGYRWVPYPHSIWDAVFLTV